MMHIKTIPNSSSADMLKKAVHVASCYGFNPIKKISIEQENLPEQAGQSDYSKKKKSFVQEISKQWIRGFEKDLSDNGIISTLQKVIEHKLLPSKQPILIHHSSIGASMNKVNDDSLRFCLAAIGMNKSIAEALVLKTAYDILDDIGIREIQICINSIGDKNSTKKFYRDLSSYLRKNANALPAQAKHSLMKKDILNVYKQLHMMHHPLEDEMPHPIKFLSDSNRRHLSEIIEYLEIVGIPYEIDNFLVEKENLCPQTLFEIRNTTETNINDVSVFAKGGRYDEISKYICRHNIPTVAIVFEFEKKGIKENELNAHKKTRKSKVYFIQLGYEAKLKSLHVIDALKKANIELYHDLNNDKLGEQIAMARRLNVPYSIIMGHREALDGTVIVRNMDTQFQNTVPIEALSEYLKKINV